MTESWRDPDPNVERGNLIRKNEAIKAACDKLKEENRLLRDDLAGRAASLKRAVTFRDECTDALKQPNVVKKKKYSFEVFWYADDNAYVARLNDPSDYRSRSWLDADPVKALEGLIKLIEDAEKNLAKIKDILTPKAASTFEATKTVVDSFDKLSEEEKQEYATGNFINSVFMGMEQSIPFCPKEDQDKVKQLIEQFKAKVARYVKE